MPSRLVTCAAALVAAVCFASSAAGQTRADCEREYRPQRGQEGKDVIWVPTEDAMVVRMLEMAKVTAADVVYDLGAGDGKIPIAAAKHFGATAVGIEYDADLVSHAECLLRAEGLQDRVTMRQGDIFETDFSSATVVTLYLLPALNLRLRPTLLAMPPGTRVVSYSFTMGDWEPDNYVDTDDGSAYFWIVPADAGGDWTFQPQGEGEPLAIRLEQTFQTLRGAVGDERATGKLLGAELELAFGREGGRTRVTGTVRGDRIEATVARGDRLLRYSGSRSRPSP